MQNNHTTKNLYIYGMNKILLLCILFIVFGCKKKDEEVKPVYINQQSLPVSVTIDSTQSIKDTFFYSILDDSITYISYSADVNNYIYNQNGFDIIINNIEPDSIKVGKYTNEYLVSGAKYGFELIHSVYVGDGSRVGLFIGSTATQINYLEITKVQNDSLWMTFDVHWTYTHWLYTDKNKSGTIVGVLNGFKYR